MCISFYLLSCCRHTRHPTARITGVGLKQSCRRRLPVLVNALSLAWQVFCVVDPSSVRVAHEIHARFAFQHVAKPLLAAGMPRIRSLACLLRALLTKFR
jgi:hypothetical protein